MYDIVFDEKAVEYLEKLERKDRRRIFEKIIRPEKIHFVILNYYLVETSLN